MQHLPIQKCLAGKNIKELSDIELLAIILGSGSRKNPVIELAARVYHSYRGLSGIYISGIRELAMQHGIGMTKAIRVLAALEAGRRIISSHSENNELCNTPLKVWRLLLPDISCIKQEEFRVLVLDNKNRIIRITRISIGTLSETIVHPREIFRDAIRESGASIIIAHNHPSGVLNPSKEDLSLTRRVQQAGEIVGIGLLDHLIVSEKGYLSMKESGYLN